MKKVSLILLSVLLIASMFISCDNSTKMKDELVQVTLSAGDYRSLVVSSEIETLDSVNWFYKATKVSETQFDFGAKSEETSIILFPGQGEEKQILTLSQGKWDFELFGRKADGTLLYYGIVEDALIIKSTTPTSVVIGVSPYTTAPGTLVLDNVTIKLATANGTTTDVSPNYLKVNNTEYFDFTGSKKISGLSAGQYTVTVAWKQTVEEDNPNTEAIETSYEVVVASETVVVTVYGGRTTTITGSVSEETGSGIINGEVEIKTEGTVSTTVVGGAPTTFTSNVAPVNSIYSNQVENTTVTFAADKLDADKTATMTITVKDISQSAEESDFKVIEGVNPVAGISLELQVGDSAVSGEFGEAKIVTYIARNLSNVKVYYGTELIAEDTEATDIYDPETGKLTFSTTHFSEFYVGASEFGALNETTNVVYESFTDAFAEATSGDTVKLFKNVSLSSVLEIGKSITLNGNGYEIQNTAKRVIRITAPNLDVKMYDLGIISKCTETSDVRGISFDDTSSGTSLLLDGCSISASFYAINVICGPKNLNVTIKNGTVAAGWAAINCYANDSTFTIENSVLKGLNDKGESSWNDFATIVFDGNGLWDASNIGKYGSGNTLIIDNSTVYASSESENNQAWLAIQYGAWNNNIELTDTKVIDLSGNNQIDNIVFDPIIGYENPNSFTTYDVHSTISIDGAVELYCCHGTGTNHVPYPECE